MDAGSGCVHVTDALPIGSVGQPARADVGADRERLGLAQAGAVAVEDQRPALLVLTHQARVLEVRDQRVLEEKRLKSDSMSSL